MKSNIPSLETLKGKGQKDLVAAINSLAPELDSRIMTAGLSMFVLCADIPHDVGMKTHLGGKGVDTKSAPQNAFQIANCAKLIGVAEESQPAVETAPKVSEETFTAPKVVRTLIAVSRCLNLLDKAISEKAIPESERLGHHVKLCGFIVAKNAKGAAEYAKTLKSEDGADADPEELPEEIETCEDFLKAIAALTLRAPKLKWTEETAKKAVILVDGLLMAVPTMQPVELAKAA